eukprot:gnl/TRDRNA2_/TRDRNA2_128663_c0_seq3.p1 gnl/TRDRNA2_/TRDRNA2_128663_c0~~gnl/TRDRNA2_/TRDRNA2_128663_c0_seq3.p1  ORF type:complete len:638 (+),score=89.22 gnl/TRDRNA2_/TRDRNA2_128663_c0_seq3:126-1916(+)
MSAAGHQAPRAPASDEADVKDTFASANSIIITSMLLLIIVLSYRINTNRLRHLPESGAAIALGFFTGLTVRVLDLIEEEQLLSFNGEFFFFVLLPPIIFEAGLSLETRIFVDNLGAILLFAIGGTLVSAWVVAEGTLWFANLGILGLVKEQDLGISCNLFGALISATDPVATIALFGSSRFRADPWLQSVINGESVLNDAVAIVLFSAMHHKLDRASPSLLSSAVLGHFFIVFIGSLVYGLATGALCSFFFRSSAFFSRFPDYEISTMCLGAYLCFALSQFLGLSGIVALFFFGTVLAHYNWHNLSEPSKVASKVVFRVLSMLAESCVFVYLGVVAALSIGRFHWHMGLVVFMLILITIARAAHVFPFSSLLNLGRSRKINHNMKIMMWVSGLRGAIAFALSLRMRCSDGLPRLALAPREECRNSDLFVTTTISVVIITTLAVGASMEHVATALGVIELVHGRDVQSLSVPLAARSAFSSAATSSPTSAAAVAPSEAARSTQESSSSNGSNGGLRNLGSVRINPRGHLYQAFARFDQTHLQPVLGGPSRPRTSLSDDAVELPSIQDFIGQPSMRRGSFQEQPEEDAPTWSRSVIFE